MEAFTVKTAWLPTPPEATVTRGQLSLHHPTDPTGHAAAKFRFVHADTKEALINALRDGTGDQFAAALEQAGGDAESALASHLDATVAVDTVTVGAETTWRAAVEAIERHAREGRASTVLHRTSGWTERTTDEHPLTITADVAALLTRFGYQQWGDTDVHIRSITGETE